MIILAGGIGAGKSIVARILRLGGYGVFDCDFEAANLMENTATVVRQIQNIAGEDSYRNGLLDRKYLSARIFSDKGIREKINSVVHKAVREKIVEWSQRSENNIFVETAIAATSGLIQNAVEVWYVDADLSTRLERVKMRDGRTEEEILSIMKVQERELELLVSSGTRIRKINNNSSKHLIDRISELLSLNCKK